MGWFLMKLEAQNWNCVVIHNCVVSGALLLLVLDCHVRFLLKLYFPWEYSIVRIQYLAVVRYQRK